MEQFYSSLLVIASHNDDIVAIMHHSRVLTGSLHGGKRFHPLNTFPTAQFSCDEMFLLSPDGSEEIIDDNESRVHVGTIRMFVPLVFIQSVAVNSLGPMSNDVCGSTMHHSSSSLHWLGDSPAIAPFQCELRGEIYTDDRCLKTTPPGVGITQGGTLSWAPTFTMATS